MAKRRVKKRTHVGASGTAAPIKPGERSPKSMVIRIGASDVGPSVTQLVKDVRSMMEPGTAARLKERRSNKLRDYTTMAGPLGVTHLMLFSRSENGNTNLRLALTPRGPTLHFRVERYSLSKDVHKSMKRPRSGGAEYLTAPLLVMNNFASPEGQNGEHSQKKIPRHLESLATTIFQSLFPPINPASMPLNSIKRVLLLDRTPQAPSADSATYTLNLRHFAIETRTAKSIPKSLRRLDAAEKLTHAGSKRKRALPNLSQLDDVADYILDPNSTAGFTSGSESEPETDAEVEFLDTSQKIPARRVRQKQQEREQLSDRRDPYRANRVEKKAIKLHELGPRLRLRLTKVEEGVCGGKVMWHEYITKSKVEQRAMDRAHEERRREKERRKAEQKANVDRKRAERQASGKPEVEDDGDQLDDEMEDDEWDDEDMEGNKDVVDDGAQLDHDEMDDDVEKSEGSGDQDG